MELKLTPRLLSIARCVSVGARMADIGTDHGYLPVRLILDGIIPCAIAADLRRGPLERARETAQRYGVTDRISFRLCDGLSQVREGETDTVVIAGMGGENIAAILNAAPWTKNAKHLLLQPMTGLPEFRGWLAANGYSIRCEHISREGKRLYSIMEVSGGTMEPLTLSEQWAGRQSDDPLRPVWLEYVAAKASKVLTGQLASKTPDAGQIGRFEQILTGIEQMKREL